jgi:hypothetical protein
VNKSILKLVLLSAMAVTISSAFALQCGGTRNPCPPEDKETWGPNGEGDNGVWDVCKKTPGNKKCVKIHN